MKDEEKHIDYDLISKYLSGETSQEEAEIIDTWRTSSQDNRVEFERLTRLWQEAEALVNRDPAPVNTERAWDQLKDRLFGEEDTVEIEKGDEAKESLSHDEDNGKRPIREDPSVASDIPKTSVRTLYYYASRIAAVLVLGILIYALFQRGGGRPDQIEVIAKNEIMVTDLPDNTQITLNENSRITYPEKFNTEERKIELSGEAFFEVTSVEEKPFIVRAHNAIIKVLGTSFNVRAVDSETEISVTVEEGKVRLSDEEDVAYVIIERNEKGILNRETGHIEKYEKAEGNEMFWKSRTLMFRDTELSAVFITLERLYNAEIIIKNDKILSCVLTGKFEDMNLEEILDKIAINFNLTVLKNKDTFEISGDGC